MNQYQSRSQSAVAALIGVAVLNTVMLLALFAGADPAPPAFVGPLIGATIAAAACTIPLVLWRHRFRLAGTAIVLLTAIPGVGPQKFLIEPDILVLSPVVTLGTICLGILVAYIIGEVTDRRAASVSGRRLSNVAASGD